jgi:hypothetical protein
LMLSFCSVGPFFGSTRAASILPPRPQCKRRLHRRRRIRAIGHARLRVIVVAPSLFFNLVLHAEALAFDDDRVGARSAG